MYGLQVKRLHEKVKNDIRYKIYSEVEVHVVPL